MNWFIAKIVFKIDSPSAGHKTQFDEQLRLITAEDQEEAFHKARIIGLNEEESFLNDNRKVVKWEFINVSDILPVSAPGDGMEIHSRIYEMEEESHHVNFVHQKAITLRLNSRPIY